MTPLSSSPAHMPEAAIHALDIPWRNGSFLPRRFGRLGHADARRRPSHTTAPPARSLVGRPGGRSIRRLRPRSSVRRGDDRIDRIRGRGTFIAVFVATPGQKRSMRKSVPAGRATPATVACPRQRTSDRRGCTAHHVRTCIVQCATPRSANRQDVRGHPPVALPWRRRRSEGEARSSRETRPNGPPTTKQGRNAPAPRTRA